jgi:hypothetical protein
LKQAQRILRWAEGRDDEHEAESAESAVPSSAAGTPAAIAAAPADEVIASDSAADPIPQAVAKPD